MANPAPKLNIGVSGSPPTANIDLSTFKGSLTLSIPDNAHLANEGRVYALIGAPDNPDLTGDSVAAGKWIAPPPPADPEDGSYQRKTGLSVEVSHEQLAQFAGQSVRLSYQSVGESGLTEDSEEVVLNIQ